MSPPNGHANGSFGSSGQHSTPPILPLNANSVTRYTPEQIKEFVALLEVPFDPAVIEWRVGQARNVRVIFLCYEGTMQGSCLRLMGKKLLVALTMEGKFAGEGLQSIDEDDDMLSAMARELVEKNGIGDSADAVWRSLNEEHRKLFPAVQPGALDNGESSVATAAEDKSEATELIEGAITSGPVLVFGQSSDEVRSSRRRPRTAIPEQPSLFSWN